MKITERVGKLTGSTFGISTPKIPLVGMSGPQNENQEEAPMVTRREDHSKARWCLHRPSTESKMPP